MGPLIEPADAEKGLLFLAVAGPLMGLILGIIFGAHRRHTASRIIAGTLTGALGLVVYGMWRAYGAITNALGLDSLANLGLQILMFAAVGAVLGVAGFKISALLKDSDRADDR